MGYRIFGVPADGSHIRYRNGPAAGTHIHYPGIASGFVAPSATARMFFSLGGQSNGFIGTDAQPSITTTQVADALRVSGRPNASNGTTGVALLEADIAPNFGETGGTALANIFHALDPSGRQAIVHCWAVGSTPYSGLAQGTANYTFGQAGMANARTWINANRPAEQFLVGALCFDHGETDEGNGVTAAAYAAFMNTLQLNFQADARTLTGQTARVILLLYQHASSAQLNPASNTMNTAVGSWLATLNSPDIYMWGPAYPLAYVAANPHLTNTANRRAGCYAGRALKRILIDGAAWRPLQPNAIVATNNSVVIDFVGGDETTALVLDTTNVVRRGHTYGFDYSDGQADIPVITSVALTGPRQVTLTLNRNAQSPARVTYGMYSAVPYNLGGAVALAAGGNLRDQDPTLNGYEAAATPDPLPLNNWSVIFDRAVDSVAGSASATTPFANANSIDSTGAAGNLASAYALATLNGAANATWEFYIRSNAASWPANNDIMGRAGSGQRQFEFRTASSNTLNFFISSTQSDNANFVTSTGWTAQTWHHVIVVKSGTTLTIYRNGVNVTGTLTGSIAATLTSPISDFQLLNGNNAAPANFNMAHPCLYLRALSAADVAERENGGVPIDPRLLSTGGPNHYWQPNGEDLGSSPSRTLRFFGALTIEAIHP